MSDPSMAHTYTFPPFPAHPAGVSITPYADFIDDFGIRVEAREDGKEVDKMGIPTVELAMAHWHSTDACKTTALQVRSAIARKKKKGKGGGGGIVTNEEWWVVWADAPFRQTNYDRFTSPEQRLMDAQIDFKSSRPHWPNDVNKIYAPWLKFLGLLDGPHNGPGVSDKVDEQSDDELSDDEDLPETVQPTTLIEGVEEAENLLEYLQDPEKATKIFLSSYMRAQGLIWSDRNLLNAPRLLRFFTEYLYKNSVFIDNYSIHKGLDRATTVIDLAEKELPMTSKIAKDLPDAFGHACREVWKTRDSFTITWDAPPAPVDPPQIAGDVDENDVEMTEAQQVEPESPTSTAPSNYSWGQGPSQWGEGGGGGWDTMVESRSDDGVEIPAGAEPDTKAGADWQTETTPSLLHLLGPSTFILTHIPGVAEWSIRRIKSIARATPLAPKAPISENPDPEVIETVLECKFVRVVLSPWPEWSEWAFPKSGSSGDGEEHKMLPRILNDSQGPVDLPGYTYDQSRSYGEVKVHNPLTDDITVLFKEEATANFQIGMGIGGNWVQLAWRADVEGEVSDKPKKKKKKAKGGKLLKPGERYWYCETVTITSPSFHIIPSSSA